MKQTKKLLSLFLSLAMLLSVTAGLDFSAYAYVSGDYQYNILSNGTAEIKDYNGNGGKVIIPSKLDGYTVSSIGSGAFSYCTSLTSVTIPDSVTGIVYSAFECCRSLISITIPKSVTDIYYGAFVCCDKLTDVYYTGTEAQWNRISINACNDCLTNATIHYSYVPPCNHKVVIDKAVAPTCTTSGKTEGSHCSVCSSIIKKQLTLPAKGHTIVTDNAVAATCYKTGLTEGSHCAVCGAILESQRAVAKLPHNIAIDEAVEPTCATSGLTEGSHCADCGEVLEPQQIVAKLPHNIVIDEAVEPTCTTSGLTEGSHCADCGETLKPQSVISAVGHSTIISNSKIPTCTEAGYMGDEICTICNKILKKGQIIEKESHNYIETITPPTCEQKGYTTYSCATCYATFTSDFVDELGHNIVIDDSIEPTCATLGLTEGSHCAVCGEVLEPQQIVAKLPHNIVIDEAVEPTCTTLGLTVGSHCSDCDLVMKAQEVIPAAGHSFEEWETIASPDCTNSGSKQRTCENCGFTETENLNPKGHNWNSSYTVDTQATCTSNGSKSIHCSNCNAVKDSQIIPAAGHSFGEYSVTKPADCVENGVEKRNCSVCNAEETRTIQALGHDYLNEFIIDKAATCIGDGVQSKHCSRCDSKTDVTVIPATGHNYDSGKITQQATCTSNGVMTYTCTVCGETKTEAVAKKAHTYKTTITKATISKNGSAVTKCTVCGNIKSKSTIYYPKTITLSATSYTYDGKAKKPGVTVKDSKGKTISASNYTVTYASGRKNVGKYSVNITFKGNYSGSKTLYFTINPKATTLSSITAKSKGFTVKWKKQATQTTGYEIQYATDSKFTKNKKTVTVSKNSTTSKAISKLSAKKKYYVRIRTYKTVKVNGKSTKIYSSWSKAKTVTTKK